MALTFRKAVNSLLYCQVRCPRCHAPKGIYCNGPKVCAARIKARKAVKS